MASLNEIFRQARPSGQPDRDDDAATKSAEAIQAHYTRNGHTYATVVSMPLDPTDTTDTTDPSHYWLHLYVVNEKPMPSSIYNVSLSGNQLTQALASCTPPIPMESGWTEGAAPAASATLSR